MPEWAKNYGDYEPMVRSWPYEVVSFDTCGSYQGDHVVLLADGDRRGFLMIGYGSCSGCDALEAAKPWEDDGDWTGVRQIEREQRESIHWESSGPELADWLSARFADEGKGTDWYWYDDEVKAVTRRYIVALRDSAPSAQKGDQ